MQIAVHGSPPYNAGQMAKTKTKVRSEAFRLTDTASRLLLACAQAGGVSKAAILETAIREYAKRKGITLPPMEEPEALAKQDAAKEGE